VLFPRDRQRLSP